MWFSFKASKVTLFIFLSVLRKEVAEIYHDRFSEFSLSDERHGPIRHMCNEPGRKAGDIWGEREKEEREKQTRVALQRLDYRESWESGWTVSLAPWHTAAQASSSLSHASQFPSFSGDINVRRVYSTHERMRCAERADCTLHTCRTARWCTLRHICKLLDTRARYTGSFLLSLGQGNRLYRI